MHIESSWIYLLIFVASSVISSVYFVTKLESSTQSNKVFFTSEISHLKEFFNEKICYVKEDIGRLEKKQEESNQIKERLVVQEQSNKSLHKRMDEHMGKES